VSSVARTACLTIETSQVPLPAENKPEEAGLVPVSHAVHMLWHINARFHLMHERRQNYTTAPSTVLAFRYRFFFVASSAQRKLDSQSKPNSGSVSQAPSILPEAVLSPVAL